MSREVAKLCIGGLELDPRLVRRGLDGLMGWEGDRLEEEKCAHLQLPRPLSVAVAQMPARRRTLIQKHRL